MGVKNKFSSEYKRSFKSKYPCFTKLYEQNLGYRLQRRSIEHFHHIEPFLWDTDSSENDSDQSNCVDLVKPAKPASIPPHIYKHEKYNKAYHNQLQTLKEKFQSNLKVTDPSDAIKNKATTTLVQHVEEEEKRQNDTPKSEGNAVIQHKVTHDKPQNNENNLETSARSEIQDPSSGSKLQQEPRWRKVAHEKTEPARLRSKSAARYVPKPRPFSEPLGRSLKKDVEEDQDDKAPFLPYGYKDHTVYIGKKKTYNVRASADIHPSALLAQKRRKALISKQEELEKSAQYQEKQKRALYNEFNERVRRETSQWETEYRHHFAGYNKEIYERSLSARPASRRHDSSLLAATW